MPDELTHLLDESVNEGVYRLRRPTSGLLATGFVGGIDVCVGVYAALLVLEGTGNEFLAALAFSFGFIALTLAGSELFTENFLMPVTALATGKGSLGEVLRLWVGTLVMNLVGGVVLIMIVLQAFPELDQAAIDKGMAFVETGPGLTLFLSAVLAGVIITLMTWMQLQVSTGVKLVAAVGAAFLLHYGGLGHVVVASLEILGAVWSGGDATVGDWLPLFGIMTVGNVVGGIGLVTIVRLVQLGPDRVKRQQGRRVAAENQPTPAEQRATRKDERQRDDDGALDVAEDPYAEEAEEDVTSA